MSYLKTVRCHKVTIVQSVFESEDLMREAHRPHITDLSKKHRSCLSDNAHEFKGTVVLDGGSILYSVHHQLEEWKHVRDFSWPVCAEKLPALGVLSQDGI